MVPNAQNKKWSNKNLIELLNKKFKTQWRFSINKQQQNYNNLWKIRAQWHLSQTLRATKCITEFTTKGQSWTSKLSRAEAIILKSAVWNEIEHWPEWNREGNWRGRSARRWRLAPLWDGHCGRKTRPGKRARLLLRFDPFHVTALNCTGKWKLSAYWNY